jgi:microcin C transport system substrate-binding protein
LNATLFGRACAILIAAPLVFATAAPAQEVPANNWRHGLSLFGDLKYPPGFKHFDYVNPAAPRAERCA